MLDNLPLSQKLEVARMWVLWSADGQVPPIHEYPRSFLQLLEECRDQAKGMEPADPPPASSEPEPVQAEDVHPVSSVYVPDEPSRGFLRDMGRPSTKGHKIVDLVRFRRHLRVGGAQ